MSSLNSLKDEFIQDFDKIKSEGEFFGEISTTTGIVDLLCEIEVSDSGKMLHLKDVTIYPKKEKALKGLAIKEMFNLRSIFEDAARELGFDKLRITGRRHEQSTSANPGHPIDKIIDLKRRSDRR